MATGVAGPHCRRSAVPRPVDLSGNQRVGEVADSLDSDGVGVPQMHEFCEVRLIPVPPGGPLHMMSPGCSVTVCMRNFSHSARRQIVVRCSYTPLLGLLWPTRVPVAAGPA